MHLNLTNEFKFVILILNHKKKGYYMLDAKNENEIKAEAKPYEKWIYNIDELVSLINEYREKGENCFFEFKNEKFYSLLDNEESCYKKLTGMTKDEYVEKQERLRKEQERRDEEEKQRAIKNIPNWIEKGKKYIYPQRYKKWTECVEYRAEDIYHGMDLNCALEIMDHLDKGVPFQQVYDIMKEQNHTGLSYSTVMSMITNFSKKGPEFYRFVDREPTPATEKFLEKVEKENEQFAQELK